MYHRALKSWRILVATLFVIAAPTAALAARGHTTTDVHMRAGPGTEYPVVATVPGGAGLTIHGCLNDHDWCDVTWSGDRGWISADYLNYFYNNHYVYLPEYVDTVDVPIVAFSLDTYWNDYYVGRPWYHRRAHWARFWREHGRHGHDRGDHRHAGRPGRDHHHAGEHHPGAGIIGRDHRGQHGRHGVAGRPGHRHVIGGRHGPAMVHRPHAPRPHMARPHLNRLHMARTHFNRPHMARPHFNRPHMSRPQMARPHMAAPHGMGAHAQGGHPGRGRHH